MPTADKTSYGISPDLYSEPPDLGARQFCAQLPGRIFLSGIFL
jgi:hypothetical protein